MWLASNVWSHNRYIARSIRLDYVYLMQFVFNEFVDLVPGEPLLEWVSSIVRQLRGEEYTTDSDVEVVID